jgi:Xaa-Pro aminopeptidase
MDRIGEAVLVIRGAAPPAGSFPFFQGTDFYYLTGVEIPDAALIVDGRRKTSLLFFSLTEREADGMGLPLELVRSPAEYTGIPQVLPLERFSDQLSRLVQSAAAVYTPFRPEELSRDNTKEKFNALRRAMTLDLWDGRLTRELQFVHQLSRRFPGLEVNDASPLLWNLRMIKTPAEIELLRRAARIGVEAHKALIQSTRPGVSERELAAVFEFVCKTGGAEDLAYETILMSGKNHAYGHYHAHDRTLRDGDFVILDAGPDFAYYHADISSTFPAGGRFSPEQRELYELGLSVRKVCLDHYRPGITFKDVGERIRQHLLEEGIDPSSPQLRGEIRYGGYNHMIGLATHDPVGTFAGPDEVLKPGFVFACDIGIAYPEKELGIRIEDTVAITEDGCENLSAGLPRTVAEIEALMKTAGIIQVLKDNGRYQQ